MKNVLKPSLGRITLATPQGIHRALPSILLGTLFNILDAVSTGLLVFPSNGTAFKALQIQAMSMYIISTILSQAVMTLGGSGFPGALGAMLIEILPFLRGIGTDIQRALGDESPSLIPTIMAAYALTSFLIGFLFVALGVFKAGLLVAYFPKTVLTGIIGGIGVSLFILGLGLPLPPSSPALTLSSVGSVLFGINHLGVLIASCAPAFFLSISIRSNFLRRYTFGATKHAYYVPLYFIIIPFVFWITALILHKTNAVGMATLIRNGWLFEVDDSVKRQRGLGNAWIYWKLFDFSKVEIHALKSATTNIVLLVVIGVLNLPIYVPALGFSLNVPFNMNREFIGQGAANILAGMAGTVPNILQLSYSVFFTRAGGGRFEAAIVTALTFVFFLVSSLVLPYVPTILASTLVLFLGIELTSEAVWESAKTLLFTEWLVVMTTLIACTFLGFAPGFGVGIGAATVVYLFWGLVDTVSLSTIGFFDRIDKGNQKAKLVDLDEKDNDDEYHHSPGNASAPWASVRFRSRGDWDFSTAAAPRFDMDVEHQYGSLKQNTPQTPAVDSLSRITLISLSGYVFFATIPSLESRIDAKKVGPELYQFMIVDLTNVHRLETSAVELLEHKAREDVDIRALVFCGVKPHSAAYADLRRGGITLNFGAPWIKSFSSEMTQSGPLAFVNRVHAIEWCKSQAKNVIPAEYSSARGSSETAIKDIESDEGAVMLFSKLSQAEGLFKQLFSQAPHVVAEQEPENLATLITQFKAGGGSIQRYEPGELIKKRDDSFTRFIFIVQGRVFVPELHLNIPGYRSRPSLLDALYSYTRTAFSIIRRRKSTYMTGKAPEISISRTFGTGESFAITDGMLGTGIHEIPWTRGDQVEVSSDGACWTIEVHKNGIGSLLWPPLVT